VRWIVIRQSAFFVSSFSYCVYDSCMMKFFLLCALVMMPAAVSAQSPAEVVGGVVVEASDAQQGAVVGFDLETFEQVIVVDVGTEKVRFRNDFTPVEVGQRVFVRREQGEDGEWYFSLYDIDRSGVLIFVVGLFAALVLALNFRKGMRSLLSLVVTVLAVFFVLLPLLKAGYSPTLVGSVVAIALLSLVMILTHGLNVRTYVAMGGISFSIFVTAFLAQFVLARGRFTGLADDESFAVMTSGLNIDMVELLFVGILIGMLGVLDDVAITQASATQQLYNAGARGKKLFLQAMRIGQDHVGALVNTLVLAYTGAALPLLILTTLKVEPLPAILSIEIVTSEIMRALLGSIGIVLTVPLTTFLAVVFITKMSSHGDEVHTHHH